MEFWTGFVVGGMIVAIVGLAAFVVWAQGFYK